VIRKSGGSGELASVERAQTCLSHYEGFIRRGVMSRRCNVTLMNNNGADAVKRHFMMYQLMVPSSSRSLEKGVRFSRTTAGARIYFIHEARERALAAIGRRYA